jgi:hypothetical protein
MKIKVFSEYGDAVQEAAEITAYLQSKVPFEVLQLNGSKERYIVQRRLPKEALFEVIVTDGSVQEATEENLETLKIDEEEEQPKFAERKKFLMQLLDQLERKSKKEKGHKWDC